MNTVRRIVVGADGFESSKAALRWAIHQAKLTGAVVDAVTIDTDVVVRPRVVEGQPGRVPARLGGPETYAAPREIVLNGGAVPITGPDAQGAVYRGDPYLPVADRFHPGVLGDGLDQGFHVVIEGYDIQPDLVQQRHAGPAGPDGELAELPTETTDLGHGQALRPVVDQGVDQLIELLGPDDGCNQFHASSPPFQPARFTYCACGGTCGCRPCPPAARGR